MIYHIVTFKDGTELKTPAEKVTEMGIREHFSFVGKEILDIRQVVIDTEDINNKEKQPSYEVRLSFNEDGQNITITKEELPMVMWAFLEDTKVVCLNGAFRGKGIISILPNFNAMMGWNKGYSLTPEDFELINNESVCREARNYQASVKSLCMESRTPQELLEKVKQLRLN